MMKQTEEILNAALDFLPLKSYANIVEGNALTTDWETVVPKNNIVSSGIIPLRFQLPYFREP